MIFRILIIFLGARMFAATSISQTRHKACCAKRETVLIQADFDGSTSAINHQRGRILTGSTDQATTRESDEKQLTVTCDRWYISMDGKMQCLVTKPASAPSNDMVAPENPKRPMHAMVAPENPKQPMHVYLPGLPSFGIPIWSSSPIDRISGSPLPHGVISSKGDENYSEPARGHGETIPLKPVVLEPAHIIPKPIVVHKPVLVPKPIEIPVHKPVLVHKPIEIHKPAVIHKPVEIPYHKPIYVEKPFLITIHKPVLVHKPMDIKPVEHHYDSLLSQILKQHSLLEIVPQGNPQYVQGANPHANTNVNEKPGFGGLHPTGFVSAHDSGKDTTIQGYGSEPSGQNIFQTLFSVTPQPHPSALAPSPVNELHTGIGANDKISSVDRSDSNAKSQADQVVEGVIKTIKQNNEDLTKSIFSADEDLKKIDSISSETEFGSPNELLRSTLNSTISTHTEVKGSPASVHDVNGTERYLLEEAGTSYSASKNLEDEGTYPLLVPTVDPDQMAYETKSIDSDMDAETKLDEGPDVMEDAQKEEGEELNRTIRDAPGITVDDTLRDKHRAGTILNRTTLLEIMTALKDQYLRNAEPDQLKVIEDAFDRLSSSVRNMKQLEQRPSWKESDGSKKAALELLAEKAPVDVDEWDYYSDAADDVSPEPSFLELLNVATKHKGKQTEQN